MFKRKDKGCDTGTLREDYSTADFRELSDDESTAVTGGVEAYVCLPVCLTESELTKFKPYYDDGLTVSTKTEQGYSFTIIEWVGGGMPLDLARYIADLVDEYPLVIDYDL